MAYVLIDQVDYRYFLAISIQFFRRSGRANQRAYGTTKGTSHGPMNCSIYDNVPHEIRHTLLLGNNPTITGAATAPTPTSVELCGKDDSNASSKLNNQQHGARTMDNLSSPNDSATSQRDISVSSGLADSESSPLTPGAPTSFKLHQNDRQPRSGDRKNRPQLSQVAIDSSKRNGRDVLRSSPSPSPPPPPPPPPSSSSPRLDREKRAHSMVLATDLFAFNTGRVPERAESCEELDIDFDEQVNDELYAQKKRKADMPHLFLVKRSLQKAAVVALTDYWFLLQI
ncbi:unnamed protein product [Litomosoides sigmodontis]|uniref:Uncharacterized protein n=1 Tax=Litomosoides sigmodontis TaxID=42156 RepID=A0A3P6U167_LITSI|nr:unnamed protein product [Litomosoides sigmodontis]